MGNKIRKTFKNLLYGLPILVASFLPIKEAKGQITKIENPNTIYLTFQPQDLGLGVRYDRRISRVGIYSSFSRGNYKLYNEGYINNHLKTSLGGLCYLRENSFDNSNGFFNLGFSYNTYGKKSYELGTIKENIFKPLSIEVGGGVKEGNLRAGIRFDPLKWEGSIDFGISF